MKIDRVYSAMYTDEIRSKTLTQEKVMWRCKLAVLKYADKDVERHDMKYIVSIYIMQIFQDF